MAITRKKKKPSKCKKCDGKYQLSYEDNAPLFVCDLCGDREETWKKFYEEYIILFKNKQNWDIDKHKISCIIGFFCYMYREKYNTNYIFVPQNPNPYGGKECKDAWKLLASFNNDANRVRRYIYWVFKKVIKQSTQIVSFAYLNAAGSIRKYNLQEVEKNILKRSSKLPVIFTEWCLKTAPEIFRKYELSTINDLGALLNYVKFYKIENSSEVVVLQEAERLCLIKDGKLNIKE